MRKLHGLERRLEQARVQAGMSKQEIAHRVGYEAKYIRDWFDGITQPRLFALVRLAEALSVTTDWLLGVTKPLRDPNPVMAAPPQKRDCP